MTLLSVQEVSDKYGLAPGYVRQLIQRGKLKAQRIGQRTWAVDERSVKAYVAKPRKRGPKPKRRA